MPQTTIPFIGTLTTRNIPADTQLQAGKDQVFTNCVFEVIQNSTTSEATAYVLKRTGFLTGQVIAASYYIHGGYQTIGGGGDGDSVVAAATTNTSTVASTIFCQASGSFKNCGVADGHVTSFTDTTIGAVNFILFTDSTTAGWFLADDAQGTLTFTGDTHTNTTIDNVSSLTGLYVGQKISGTGIVAGTRIATITAPSTITTTVATTATNATVTITREAIAKIIDADFPTVVGQFIPMDGYVFVTATGATVENRVYQSDLNSVISYQPQNYISAIIFNDGKRNLFKSKDKIASQGAAAIEWFFNNGNPSGSVLSQAKSMTAQVGLYSQNGKNFCNIGDDYFWVGVVGGGVGIYGIVSDSLVKVSDDAVDNIFNSFSGTQSFSTLSGFVYSGIKMLMLTINEATSPTSNRTILVCDLGKKFWNKWSSNQSTMVSTTITGSIYAYSNVLSTGTRWELIVNKNSSYQDDSVAYSMIIQTEPKSFNNGKPFIVDSIGLLADTQSSGSTTLEVSDDDYASFGTVGTYDLTMQQKTLYGGGYFETAAIFRLTDSGNNAWRGQALVVNWRPA